MQDDKLQVPVAQEVQPEVKGVPQQPFVVPQATSDEPTPPTKSKKLKLKTIIILIIALVSLVIIGFFVWKKFFVPETEKTEEGYIYKGIGTPVLDYSFSQVSMLPGKPEDYRPAMFDLDWVAESGINTLSFNVGLWANEQGEIGTLPGVKEPLISFIDEARARGFKIWLAGELLRPVIEGSPSEMRMIPEEMIENTDLMENFDSALIEWAKIAEEHNVEIFSPISEAHVNFGGERGKKWLAEIKPKIDAVYSGKICALGYWVIPELSSYSCFGPTIGVPKTEEEKNELINKIETELKKRDVELMLHLWEGNGWRGSQEEAKRGFEMAFEAGKGRVSGIFFLDFPRPTPVFPESFEDTIKEFYAEE